MTSPRRARPNWKWPACNTTSPALSTPCRPCSWGVDRWGRVTQWNREAEKATGVTSQQARHRNLEQVYPQLKPLSRLVKQAIRQRTVRQAEKVAYTVGDQIHYADIMIYPLDIETLEGAVIRVDDITARVRMEDTMVQTEKMLSVGGLAAGMAHEINNPLSGMLQSAQNIVRRLDPALEKKQHHRRPLRHHAGKHSCLSGRAGHYPFYRRHPPIRRKGHHHRIRHAAFQPAQ